MRENTTTARGWKILQDQAARDCVRWANAAEYFFTFGPSMFMHIYAKEAADALKKLASMNNALDSKTSL